MSNIDPKARTWAEIDMAALKHNFEIAKRTGKKVLCVIKATERYTAAFSWKSRAQTSSR